MVHNYSSATSKPHDLHGFGGSRQAVVDGREAQAAASPCFIERYIPATVIDWTAAAVLVLVISIVQTIGG